MLSRSSSNFYHVFADGYWEEAVSEHKAALKFSGFSGDLYVGIVGSPSKREAVKAAMPAWTVVAEADAGYEQVTLRALHAWSRFQVQEIPVLYAHTKGAAYSAREVRSKHWRHAMVHETVMACEKAEFLLADFDVAGASWEPYPNNFFFGNFWWANSSYISTLEPVSDKTRYHAEHWLGTGNPRVRDLCPDFRDKYDLHWDYYSRSFGEGHDCLGCPLEVT